MIKISARQQTKNSKVLEYLLENNYVMAYREVVLGSNNKWRVFKLYCRDGWLKINYHALWGIQVRYQKEIPQILPKPKKTNYIIWLKYLNKLYLSRYPVIIKMVKECTKETIREDISFSTLTLLKILSNNKVNYMKVDYYL